MKLAVLLKPKKWSLQQIDAQGDHFVAALRYVGWVPAFMLAIALVATWLAAQQAYKTVVSAKQIQATGVNIQAVMEKTPMREEDYKILARTFGRLHPKIGISVEKGRDGSAALRLKIDQAADYPDWTYALSVIHSMQPGVIWEVREMCLGRCSGAVATALIQGIRQAVTTKEK